MGRIITMTTDFGFEDPFIGVMKGVILGIAPDARLIDLSHAILPQDVLGAALSLEAAVPFFPPGAIHVTVVDPGVGTQRAAIAVETEAFTLVGPDNGAFTLALSRLPMKRVVHLTNDRYFRHPVSATFHGRDVFAPVAAHIANGVPLEEFGDPATELNGLDLPTARVEGNTLIGHVLAADRFGNLITDVSEETLTRFAEGAGPGLCIRLGAEEIRGLSRTYGDIPERSPVAYVGSSGRLELGIRNGSAAQRLGTKRGTRFTITHQNSTGSQ